MCIRDRVYASLGLTREECQIIIADTISKTGIVWQTDYNEDESDKAVSYTHLDVYKRQLLRCVTN